MTLTPSHDITPIHLWEESLLALARYCVHYGLDDEDEAVIRKYLDYCARTGRAPQKELTDLMLTQAERPADDSPDLLPMSLEVPEYEWVCYGEQVHEHSIRKNDRNQAFQQLAAKTEIDIRRFLADRIQPGYLADECLDINVRVIEMLPANSWLGLLWMRLQQKRKVTVFVHTRWRVRAVEPLSVQAMNTSEAIQLCQQFPCPDSMDREGELRIIDARLLNLPADIATPNY